MKGSMNDFYDQLSKMEVVSKGHTYLRQDHSRLSLLNESYSSDAAVGSSSLSISHVIQSRMSASAVAHASSSTSLSLLHSVQPPPPPVPLHRSSHTKLHHTNIFSGSSSSSSVLGASASRRALRASLLETLEGARERLEEQSRGVESLLERHRRCAGAGDSRQAFEERSRDLKEGLNNLTGPKNGRQTEPGRRLQHQYEAHAMPPSSPASYNSSSSSSTSSSCSSSRSSSPTIVPSDPDTGQTLRHLPEEFYRGSKRGSIVGPMASLDRIVAEDVKKKRARDESASPPKFCSPAASGTHQARQQRQQQQLQQQQLQQQQLQQQQQQKYNAPQSSQHRSRSAEPTGRREPLHFAPPPPQQRRQAQHQQQRQQQPLPRPASSPRSSPVSRRFPLPPPQYHHHFTAVSAPSSSSIAAVAIQLPTSGPEALRSYLLSQKLHAHLLKTSGRRLRVSLSHWITYIRHSVTQRRSLSFAIAHWSLYRSRDCLRLLKLHAAAQRETSAKTFRALALWHGTCLSWALATWRANSGEERKLKLLDVHYHVALTRRALKGLKASVQERRINNAKYAKAAALFCSSLQARSFRLWQHVLKVRRLYIMAAGHNDAQTTRRLFDRWLGFLSLRQIVHTAFLSMSLAKSKMAILAWREYVKLHRRWEAANEHAKFATKARCVASWKASVKEAGKVKAAVAMNMASSTRRAFRRLALYAEMRACKVQRKLVGAEHFRYSGRMRFFRRLKEHLVCRVDKRQKLAASAFHRSGYLYFHYFGKWCDSVAEKATGRQKNLCSVAFCEKRLLDSCFKNWSVVVVTARSDKLKLERVLSFFSSNCSRYHFSCWIRYVRARHRGYAVKAKSDRHHAEALQKRAVLRIRQFVVGAAKLRKLKSVANLFTGASLLKRSFGALRSWREDIKRRRKRADGMSKNRTLVVFEKVFDGWMTFKSLQRRAKSSIARWRKRTMVNKLIRKTARLWKFGTLISCFETWSEAVQFIKKVKKAMSFFTMSSSRRIFMAWKSLSVESKSVSMEKAVLSSSHYAGKTLSKAFVTWVEFVVEETRLKKLIAKALHWMRGNIMVRLFANWKTFVNEQHLFRKAANSWRLMNVRKCFTSMVRYVEHRHQKAELYGRAETFRSEYPLKRVFSKLRHLTSAETKKKKHLLMSAVQLFQGNIMYSMILNWKAHVVELKNTRRAVALFRNAVVVRSFAQLKRYYIFRLEKRKQVNRAALHWDDFRMSRAFKKLGRTTTHEFKEYRRRSLHVISYFVDSTKVKAWARWLEYVKETKGMRHALSIFTNSLLMRCVRKLRLYADRRLDKKRAYAFGDEHFVMRSKSRVLVKLYNVCVHGKEFKDKIKGALSWLTNSTMKRCMANWIEHVHEVKVMKHALNIFTNSLLIRCVRKLRLYADRRLDKKRAYAFGDEHFVMRSKSRVLVKLYNVCVHGKEFKDKIKGALSWLTNSTMKRCMANWIEHVALQRKMRRAVAVFSQGVVLKMWFAWRTYAWNKSEKRGRFFRAEEHRRLYALRKSLHTMHVYAHDGKKERHILARAHAWFSDMILYRMMSNWKASVKEVRAIKRALAMFQNSSKFKCFELWTRFVGEEKVVRESLRAAAELWSFKITRTFFKSWKRYFVARLEKKRLKAVGDAHHARFTLRKQVKMWKAWKVNRASIVLYKIKKSLAFESWEGRWHRRVFNALRTNWEAARYKENFCDDFWARSAMKKCFRAWAIEFAESRIETKQLSVALFVSLFMVKRKMFAKWMLYVDLVWRKKQSDNNTTAVW